MLETMGYTQAELLRERREGAVRAMVRAVGYALLTGAAPDAVGRFLFESYRLSGEYKRMLRSWGAQNGPAFAAWHMQHRWGLCDEVSLKPEGSSYTIESASMLLNHDRVMAFHGVSRLDIEACMETFWRLSAKEVGLEATYTIYGERDWMIIRTPSGTAEVGEVVQPVFTPETLAEHRRIALASGIISSIGFARSQGDEPEDLGRFFYNVWDASGYYDRLCDQWGYGNALAYAQTLAHSRQTLYTRTELVEDLDGYTIASPSWSTELPKVMGMFGVLADDVHRYFAGGGIPACSKLGLQYADRSDDRTHRVWIRSR
ncbi:MAG: hypothetical protein ACM3UP_00015 [Methanocella sp.]